MATVKIGDLVRFLDDVGEGRVVRIISDTMAEVETTDGWLLPSYIKTLVVIPEEKNNRKGSVIQEESTAIAAARVQKEVHSALINKPPVAKPSNIKFAPREVDLHINKLIDSVIGLTNTEILTIQLGAFRSELNKAIRGNEREIIFIHGIGNGTLKTELRRVAGQEFSWCQLEDASFKEYGFGATRLRIPQNKPI